MKRTTALLGALVLLVVSALPASAAGHGGTYLSLGDSVGAGTQQPLPFTDNGYTNLLARDLADRYGIDNHVNLACPGDDTAEMITGDGSLCYGPGAPLPPGGASQLDSAVEYLTSNPGEVELITIVIGANDILACNPADPGVAACVEAQLGQIAANLPVIIGTLKTVAPGVPIVAMNYYNPNLAFWIVDPALSEASQALIPLFNGTLEAIYAAFGVPVADVETAFKTFMDNGEVPLNVKKVCQYTLMCERSGPDFVFSDFDPGTPGPQTDIHPSNKGYRMIASTHFELINDLALLG